MSPSHGQVGSYECTQRVLAVYNGNTDGVCTWRSNLAWVGPVILYTPFIPTYSLNTQMKLLNTKHRDAFNAASDVDWPGVGWVRTVGAGAGDYAFVSIDDAGHCESPGPEHVVRLCIADSMARRV